MFRSIADFTRDWNYERGATGKLLALLNDSSLSQTVRPGGRSLARLAWHLVLTLVEMPGEAGLVVAGPHHGEAAPASASALAARYAEVSKALGDTVVSQWSDADLLGEIPMYGQTWTRGQVLSALIKHEAHHRGQMTVLMRQAGVTVPGVYGPAEEEWAAMGLPAQE